MKRFPAICPAVLVLVCRLLSAADHESDRPLNVLMIAIDDLKPIGSVFAEEPGNFLQHIYPDKKLRTEVANRMTPNIQRLADQGVTFMSAYCASPACNPSRAALMTGIRPHKSGLTTNAGGIFFREYEYEGRRYLEDAITLPQHLKAKGWYTASTGKIYHRRNDRKSADYPLSWTDWVDVTGDAGERVPSKFETKGLKWGQEGDSSARFVKLDDYRKADFMARVLENGQASFDGETFKVSEDHPFFLALGIFRPHLPFYATKDLLDLFPEEEMTVTYELLEKFKLDGDDVPEYAFKWSGLSRNAKGEPELGDDRFTLMLEHGRSVDPDEGDLKGWKDMLKHYFASCAIADRAVGRILDGLENSPYADNTMVILWSDHGYALGEKLHVTKFALWDSANRVNLFIKDPRNPQGAGQKCFSPVSLIDLYPTVVAMAGLDLPDPRITGHDLSPLLKKPGAKWRVSAQSTYSSVDNNMIRNARYKLIQYENGSREVYDMRRDPEEIKNLAGKRSARKAEAQLDKLHTIAIEEGTYSDN